MRREGIIMNEDGLTESQKKKMALQQVMRQAERQSWRETFYQNEAYFRELTL